jgi:hypothetical protein
VTEINSYPPPARVSHLKDIDGDPLWEVEISTLEELIDYIRACGDNVVIRLAVEVDKEIHNVLHIASTAWHPSPSLLPHRQMAKISPSLPSRYVNASSAGALDALTRET